MSLPTVDTLKEHIAKVADAAAAITAQSADHAAAAAARLPSPADLTAPPEVAGDGA